MPEFIGNTFTIAPLIGPFETMPLSVVATGGGSGAASVLVALPPLRPLQADCSITARKKIGVIMKYRVFMALSFICPIISP
jgi:hypothetical protein